MNNLNPIINNTLMPKNVVVSKAIEDRIISNQNIAYYNYDNQNLRWLCGYNNQDVSNIIQEDISIVKDNPTQITEIQKQVVNTLKTNAGKKYSKIIFSEENIYQKLGDYLLSEGKYFLSFTRNLNIDESIKSKIVYIGDIVGMENLFEISIKDFRRFLKDNRNKIAGCILTPIIYEEGLFLKNGTAKDIEGALKKLKIPLIWDESKTAFYKSGTFYFLNQYSIEPDFITISMAVNKNINLNTCLCTKKAYKKLKNLPTTKSETIISTLIVLHSLLLYINDNNLPKRIKSTGRRLSRKLRALSNNTHKSFTCESKGLINIIKINVSFRVERLAEFLQKNHLLIYTNDENSFITLPQIILTNKAVDVLIQTLDEFFKNNLKLPTHS